MKLGIFLLCENFHANPHAVIHNDIELGVLAEKLGFDEVWFAEHHFNAFSVIPSPSLMMATLAAKTSRIRIGSAAFLAPFYHPARLAEEIAVLDVLSNGRINAGFAKGGFTLDMEYFEKDSQSLRAELFENVESIDKSLHLHRVLQPKSLQARIPFYIATFSTKESIEYAAAHGYGLMFSQGATIDECKAACEYYRTIAGDEPEVVIMRVFSMAPTATQAHEEALIATDHFVKSMRSLNSHAAQPRFNRANYEELLAQRHDFFDAKKFMQNAIIGTKEEVKKEILKIEKSFAKLHLVLKVASTHAGKTRKVLRELSQILQLQ